MTEVVARPVEDDGRGVRVMWVAMARMRWVCAVGARGGDGVGGRACVIELSSEPERTKCVCPAYVRFGPLNMRISCAYRGTEAGLACPRVRSHVPPF